MADPKLQIEQTVERLEQAIRALAHWLTQNPDEAMDVHTIEERIDKILRGEESRETDASE